MKVVAYCKDCDHEIHKPEGEWSRVECSGCRRVYDLHSTDALRRGEPDRCAVCGYAHLHVRKDFPRALGLWIVLIAAVLTFTPITPPGFFWLPLVVASAIDLLLYQLIPWKVVCYVCEAEYRGAKVPEGLGPYDLATATEHKRLKWPQAPKPSGSPEAAA